MVAPSVDAIRFTTSSSTLLTSVADLGVRSRLPQIRELPCGAPDIPVGGCLLPLLQLEDTHPLLGGTVASDDGDNGQNVVCFRYILENLPSNGIERQRKSWHFIIRQVFADTTSS